MKIKHLKTAICSMGFTLVELLVVIGIIGVLAGLLFPVLSKAKARAGGAVCMNNLKQLSLGWTMYANDNKEKLMLNTSGLAWIGHGNLTWDSSPMNSNVQVLVDPKLAAMSAYVKSVGVYKCPNDRFQSAANPGPRTRSVSMNGALNQKPTFINKNGRKYFTAKKLPDLSTPGPSSVFVFLDEHADSIDDGCFMVDPGYAPGEERWRNLPASYHNGAGGFSFADGHSELHKWLEQGGENKTVYPVRMTGLPDAQPWITQRIGFTSRDYEWVVEGMPYH